MLAPDLFLLCGGIEVGNCISEEVKSKHLPKKWSILSFFLLTRGSIGADLLAGGGVPACPASCAATVCCTLL